MYIRQIFLIQIKYRQFHTPWLDYPLSEIRELKYAIFSTICSIVYKYCTVCSIVYKYCTQPISKHLHSLQGYLGILWIQNTKSSKKDWIHKYYVSCLKLEYFLQVVKLNPWMSIIFNKWPWDGTLKTCCKNVACRAGST